MYQDRIRHYFDENNKKYYFSVVDIVGLITETQNPRNYWKVQKNRLKYTNIELVTKCRPYKMRSGDGKFYLTDTVDKEAALEIINLINPDQATPIKSWFITLEEGEYEDLTPPDQDLVNEPEEDELKLMVDAYKTLHSIIIKAFIAGVDLKNISILVNSKSVTIKGNRRKPKDIYITRSREQEYMAEELYWGKFSRTISLPNEIEISQVEAEEYRGLITIKLPLLVKERPRQIRINKVNSLD